MIPEINILLVIFFLLSSKIVSTLFQGDLSSNKATELSIRYIIYLSISLTYNSLMILFVFFVSSHDHYFLLMPHK